MRISWLSLTSITMCSLRLYFIFVLFTLSQESILEKEDNDTSIDEESYDRLYFESKNDSFFSQDVSENNYEIQSDAATGGGIEEYNISKISDYLKELKEKNRKVKEQQEIEEALENNMTKRNSSVSLAFVFDSTGSMWDDLEQLKEGAGAIMTTMMERQLENPIYNYILVPFHDPAIGPVTVTRDTKVFQEALEVLHPHGGGDCPEMAVKAILTALNIALPNSYIYVFTDARAKDPKVLDQVAPVIQRKKAQVVFLLTGDCPETDLDGIDVFYKIAQISNGQVFNINKNNVEEVLGFIRLSLDDRRVQLMSVSAIGPTEHRLNIDHTVQEFQLAAAGEKLNINIVAPDNVTSVNLESENNTLLIKPLLDLKNVKIVNVVDPPPGEWRVQVESEAGHSLSGTGITTLKFQFGFTQDSTLKDLSKAFFRPLIESNTTLLVRVTPFTDVENVTDVRLLNFSRHQIQEFSLIPIEDDNSGLYRTEPFLPPDEYFYLEINGFGKDGFPFQRLSSSAVSPDSPVPPVVQMNSNIKGWVGEQVVLRCRVESVVLVGVIWLKEHEILKREQFKQSGDSYLSIDSPDESSEGNYTCKASNKAGSNKANVYLTINGPPPDVTTRPQIVSAPGAQVEIPCHVQSKLNYNITWFKIPDNKTENLISVLSTVHISQSDSGSLIIHTVNQNNHGLYLCQASNKGGIGAGQTFLVVHQLVHTSISLGKEIFYQQQDTVILECNSTGFPLPIVEWRKKDNPTSILSSLKKQYTNSIIAILELLDLEEVHQGDYECFAHNDIDMHISTVKLIYQEMPTVTVEKSFYKMSSNSNISLQCKITGYPKPIVKWAKNGDSIEFNERINTNEDNSLIIGSVGLNDSGEYSCKAQNELGSGDAFIQVVVGQPPKPLHFRQDVYIKLGEEGWIDCLAIEGDPPPKLQWYRHDRRQFSKNHISSDDEHGILIMQDATLDEAGEYICSLDNEFGHAEFLVNVIITGAVSPLLDPASIMSNPTGNLTTLSGHSVRLPCRILLGRPQPTISWLRDGELLDKQQMEREGIYIVNENNENTLVIGSIDSEIHSGTYECVAKNPLGAASHAITVHIFEPPSFPETQQAQLERRAIAGHKITLPCSSHGQPSPIITWTKDHMPIIFNQNISLLEDQSLVLLSPTERESGLYQCTATNAAGSASQQTALLIQIPPSILSPHLNQVSVIAGQMITLTCIITGIPSPSVNWHHNGIRLQPGAGLHLIHWPHKNQYTLSVLARAEHSGDYSCEASNSIGVSTHQMHLDILVPPHIYPPDDEWHRISTGQELLLGCHVTADPKATIIWTKDGQVLDLEKLNEENLENDLMGLENNEKDLGERITLSSVNKLSAGVYICTAENKAGLSQKAFYVDILEPPHIIEEIPHNISLIEGEDYAIACQAEGRPLPDVRWLRAGTSLNIANAETDQDVLVLEDGTLLLSAVTVNTSDMYTCLAENAQGMDQRHVLVQVLVAPSLLDTSDSGISVQEVIEGAPMILACPAMEAVPAPEITWLKDGYSLTLSSRGDTPRVMTRDQGRELHFTNADEDLDGGVYTCLARNAAGLAKASTRLVVLQPPHWTQHHQQRRITVLRGEKLQLSCLVLGIPQPRMLWRREGVPITSHTAPGVVLRSQRQILEIPRVRLMDAGFYQCGASNKAGRTERDFVIKVLIPPTIEGDEPDSQAEQAAGPVDATQFEVVQGDTLVLECPITGLPHPEIIWERSLSKDIPDIIESKEILEQDSWEIKNHNKEEEIDNSLMWANLIRGNQRKRRETTNEELWETIGLFGRFSKSNLNGKVLEIESTHLEDAGRYRCIGKNDAGERSLYFDVFILAPPSITEASVMVPLREAEGSSPSLVCHVSGVPPPDIIWLHNGRILHNITSQQYTSNSSDIYTSVLQLFKINITHTGKYSCLASNKAGVKEKNYLLRIIQAPRLGSLSTSKNIDVTTGSPWTLRCPIHQATEEGDLSIVWYKEHFDDPYAHGEELKAKHARVDDEGNYTCLAKNSAGSFKHTFSLRILEAPSWIVDQPPNEIELIANETLKLECESNGRPTPQVIWLKGPTPISELLWAEQVELGDNNITMTIEHVSKKQTGQYTCIVSNSAGYLERTFKVIINLPPTMSDSPETTLTVRLRRRLVLRCPANGSPPPNITWFKDSTPIEASNNLHISSDGRQIYIIDANLEDEGRYSCFALNPAGIFEKDFYVNVIVPSEWSPWSDWSDCSSPCGPGVQSRYRKCSSADRHVDPEDCPGSEAETRSCMSVMCQIDGGWTTWSSWTGCSEACGRGTRKRYRLCTNPAPKHGGRICHGSDTQQEFCELKPCPVHGQWSSWSVWSECNVSCGRGMRFRQRRCAAPSPAFGGDECIGNEFQQQIECSQTECPVHGGWSQWGTWSPCSVSCGEGNKQRLRTCSEPTPRFGGAPCLGSNLQITHCQNPACDDVPVAAELNIRGHLNGKRLEYALGANISEAGPNRIIKSSMDKTFNHPPDWVPYLALVLEPVSFTTAYESDHANNGYSLTKGRFTHASNIAFATGEQLYLNHIGQGTNENGVLRVDIEVEGEVPMTNSEVDIRIDPLEEDYIQTSPNKLSASTSGSVYVNGEQIPYSRNNTLSYDPKQGTMPYLVERLSQRDVTSDYDSQSRRVRYAVTSTIGRSYSNNICPSGFIADSIGPYCIELDECKDRKLNKCHPTQECENTFGSYRCFCRPGFRAKGIGKKCIDLNECHQKPSPCEYSCQNTKGSFRCSCPMGYNLHLDKRHCVLSRPPPKTDLDIYTYLNEDYENDDYVERTKKCPQGFKYEDHHCTDVNECELEDKCLPGESCINQRGGYECAETSCPALFIPINFPENNVLNACIRSCRANRCQSKALLSETMIYKQVIIYQSDSDMYLRPLLKLQVSDLVNYNGLEQSYNKNNTVYFQKTRYRILENSPGKPFRVRLENRKGILYTLKSLISGKIYRIVVDAISYDETEQHILDATKFIIFIQLFDD